MTQHGHHLQVEEHQQQVAHGQRLGLPDVGDLLEHRKYRRDGDDDEHDLADHA